MYLLDACVISDFVKGEPCALAKIKSLSPALLSTSTITVMEVEYGLGRIPERRAKIDPVIKSFFDAIEILPFCQQSALSCAQIRYNLTRKGAMIEPYDFLIASVALIHQKTLVTSNLSEFTRIEGLKVENWRGVSASN
jgi:tRNA(fMet)-specific endonuclease VapC